MKRFRKVFRRNSETYVYNKLKSTEDEGAEENRPRSANCEDNLALDTASDNDTTSQWECSSLGIAMSVAAGFFMACTSLMIKLASSLHFNEMMIARGIGVIAFCPMFMIYATQPFIPSTLKESGLVYGRAIMGCGAMSAAYFAFEHASLADVTAILFINPVWTTIFAYFILREKWSRFDSIAMLLSLIGIVLITRPTFIFPSQSSAISNTSKTLSYILTLAASIALALSYIFVRMGPRNTPALTFVFHYGVMSLFYGFVIGLALKKLKFPDCGTRDNWYAFLVGVFSFCGQACFVYALTLERAAIVALGRATDIAFVFVLEVLVLNAPVNVYSLTGCLLVFLCNVSIFLKKMCTGCTNGSE